MTTYPDEAYNPVMDYYKNLPEDLKAKASGVLSDFSKKYKKGEAPPEEMLSSLKALSRKDQNLEQRIGGKDLITSFVEGIGKIFSYEKFGPVATAATAGLLLYLGMPIY